MNAAEMSNFLKVFGNGDEQTGIDNVFKAGEVVGFSEGAVFGFKTGVVEGFKLGVIESFKTGELVGAAKTAVAMAAAYGFYRLGKWHIEKKNRQQILESN